MFASVSIRKQKVHIVIRHYTTPTKTKGGRVVPTQKFISLDLKSFQRLVLIQKKLTEDYHLQTAGLVVSARPKSGSPDQQRPEEKEKKKKKKKKNGPVSDSDSQVRMIGLEEEEAEMPYQLKKNCVSREGNQAEDNSGEEEEEEETVEEPVYQQKQPFMPPSPSMGPDGGYYYFYAPSELLPSFEDANQ